MSNPQSVLADRLVLALGFAAMLCTGFYGAEPPSIESAAIPYIRGQDGALAPLNDFP
jgi:hypothetical protein